MGIAKVTKRNLFEDAMMALHGARLDEENKVFDTEVDDCAGRNSRREVLENCFNSNYDTLLAKPIFPYNRKAVAFGFVRGEGSNLRKEFDDICFNEENNALQYSPVFYGNCIHRAYKDPNSLTLSFSGRYPCKSLYLDPDPQAAEEIKDIFRRYAAFMDGVIETAVLFRNALESATGIRELRERWTELAAFIPSKTKPVPEDAAQKLRARVDEETGRRRGITLKEAIELSIEVWSYLAEHPEISCKADLPKELYGKIKKMKSCCPLCEYIIYNNRSCMRCPLSIANGISYLECGGDQHPFSVWNHAKKRKTRKEAATAIVKLLEAALEKENRNEESN